MAGPVQAGSGARPVSSEFSIADGIRVGIMICWESFFAHHSKALVDDGAMVLIMLANEGWFGGGAAGAQHNLTARMRAVEFRRSVVVSVIWVPRSWSTRMVKCSIPGV